VVALPGFRAGKLEKIELLPIVLGYREPRPQRGRPLLADPAAGKLILEQIVKLSAPYGTRITLQEGKGFIVP
jgi:hypothetical protein